MDNNQSLIENTGNKRKMLIFLVSTLLLVGLSVYFFSNIISYLIVAFIMSLIGQPIVNFLERRLKLPRLWGSIITILLYLIFFALIVLIFVPLIADQVNAIRSLDFVRIGAELQMLLMPLQEKLWEFEILPDHLTLAKATIQSVESVLHNLHFNSIFSNIIGATSGVFIGLFSVIFILFFFLKDRSLFYNVLMALVPRNYEPQADNIYKNSRHLLSRYFIGLAIEVLAMMTLISIGLTIFGVKNALLLGLMGGFLNIIPYLGPFIGATIAAILSFVSALSGGYSPELLWIIIKVVGVFVGANMIDNFVFQPLIYSNSVKAHPLEIFIVILMAAQIGGIVGMILAIPAYTLLRIIAKEFFIHSKFINKLTKNI